MLLFVDVDEDALFTSDGSLMGGARKGGLAIVVLLGVVVVGGAGLAAEADVADGVAV